MGRLLKTTSFRTLVVAVSYGIVGLAILSVAYQRFYIAPLWPPAGIAIAAILLWGTRIWPGIFIGAFFSNYIVAEVYPQGNGASLLIALGLAFGNTLGAVLGALLVKKLIHTSDPFRKIPHLFIFLVFVGIGTPALSALIGVSVLCTAGAVSWTAFKSNWITWWLGDVIGILVMTPLIVAWYHRSVLLRRLSPRLKVESVVLLSAVLLSGLLVSGLWRPFGHLELTSGFVLMPPLLWAAFRFGFRGMTLSIALLCAIFVYGGALGLGAFGNLLSRNSVIAVQCNLAVMVITMLALAVTLRERRFAEKRQRDTEKLYQSLVDTLPLQIFRKDAEERILFGNKAFCRSLNSTLPNLMGRTDYDLFPKDLADKYRADDLYVVRSGAIFEDVENYRDAFGKKGYMHVLKTPVVGVDGRTMGVQGIAIDVTERKNAEEALVSTANELARSNEELERFAYVASHDLQEPLRTVACYCQLLEREYRGSLDARGEEYLGYLIDAAKRMQSQICALLEYSRVGRSTILAPIDCGTLVEDVVADLQGAIAECGGVVTKGILPVVHSDRSLMRALFQNLIANALKFRNGQAPQVHISAELKGESWLFKVKDNGIGIDPEYYGKIFQIFQRLHSEQSYTGTGVGLAICKKIVEFHGGNIWVESHLGKGSDFIFSIPCEMKSTHRKHAEQIAVQPLH